ncbi:MAG: hypothetical protein JXQ69_01060 [Paludibacteraceae bacterium]|nr:hypothetical protein [Paludibacteraceae bacterium]MBN2786887.1 hypothetical protein [Paludibacteraceae bacterium]
MKKMNVFFMAAILLVGLMFVSCSDDKDALPELHLTSSTVAFGESLTGTIISANGLQTVKIVRVVGDTEQAVADISSFTDFPIKKTSDDTYTIDYPGLSEGTYKITVIDMEGNEDAINFQVGSGGNLTLVKSGVVISSVQAEPSSATSCCASATGLVFSPSAATQGDIDFVYFNGNPSNLTTPNPNNGLYSPWSAAQLSVTTVASIFQNWTVRNATRFKKVADKTSASVWAGVYGDAGDNFVSDLAVGDLIAFKTEYGTFGVLTVTALGAAEGWGGNASVTVTIETFQ